MCNFNRFQLIHKCKSLRFQSRKSLIGAFKMVIEASVFPFNMITFHSYVNIYLKGYMDQFMAIFVKISFNLHQVLPATEVPFTWQL